MKLKKVLAIILAIMTTFTMVACGKKDEANTATDTNSQDSAVEATAAPTAAPAAGEKTTLRMAWWGSQTRHDRTVAVIEMYEAANPNIDIEYEFYDFDGYITKLNTLVASNEVWDMFQLGGNFPTYISKIVPLTDYINSGVVDVSNTTDAMLKTTQDKGVQIGISNGVNTYGIAYDPKMFADAGVAEPTTNWTWDDFKQACLTIHEKLGTYGSSKLDDFIAGCSAAVPQADLTKGFFNAENNGLGFDDYNMIKDYIQMRADLTAAGAYPDPGAIAEIKDIEGDYLVTGDAAMTWVASNQFIALSDAAGRELKLAPIPRKTADGPAGSTVQSSQMFCISTDSKAPEEAAKFLNFFWTNDEANKILMGERGISIFSNVVAAQAPTQDAKQVLVNDFVSLVGNFETGYINVISPQEKQEIEDNYKLLIEKVIYGEKTTDEAAKEAYDFAVTKFQ